MGADCFGDAEGNRETLNYKNSQPFHREISAKLNLIAKSYCLFVPFRVFV